MKTDSRFFLLAVLIAFCLLGLSFMAPISIAGCATQQCILLPAGTVGGALNEQCWLTGTDGAGISTGYDYSVAHADSGFGDVATGKTPITMCAPSSKIKVNGTPLCGLLDSSGTVTKINGMQLKDTWTTECFKY